jgi:hypothetical protein
VASASGVLGISFEILVIIPVNGGKITADIMMFVPLGRGSWWLSDQQPEVA